MWELVRWDGIVVDTFDTLAEAKGASIFYTGSHIRKVEEA